jgi:hypothetical protein
MEMTPDEAGHPPSEAVHGLISWLDALGPDSTEAFSTLLQAGDKPSGWLQVFAPGSVVAKRDVQNVLRDIELIGPEFVAINGPPQLFYRYKVSTSGTALVPADAVERVGDDWVMRYWNPETGDFQDAVDDLVPHPDRPVSLTDSAAAEEA